MTAGRKNLNIAAWLHGLGLQQYEQAFRDNAIDAAMLPELTAEDLRDIGIGPLGHRRKLLAAIAALPNHGGLEAAAERREVTDTAVTRRQLTVMFCPSSFGTMQSSAADAATAPRKHSRKNHSSVRIATSSGLLVAESPGLFSDSALQQS